MKWTQIIVTTSQEASEAVSNLFFELGASGVEEINGVPLLATLTAFFPADDLVGERVFKLKKLFSDLSAFGLRVEPAKIELKSLEDENWAESWKSAFSPQRIGKTICVSPTWWKGKINLPNSPRLHSPRLQSGGVVGRDSGPSTTEVLTIWLDPGMAFGTGYHATTKLALILLEEGLSGGEDVADIGTGSGILAIAAAKLGARKVTATDVDVAVVPIARKNAQLNEVEDKIEVVQGNSFEPLFSRKFDVIVANIVTKVIIPMIPDCRRYLNPNGKVIFSGILASEKEKVTTALIANRFEIVKVLEMEDWVGVLGRTLER